MAQNILVLNIVKTGQETLHFSLKVGIGAIFLFLILFTSIWTI